MKSNRGSNPKLKIAVLVAAALINFSGAAQAQANAGEHADYERSRLMSLNLIEAMVENGILTRDKADKIIAAAEAKTDADMKSQSEVQFKSRYDQPAPATASVASANAQLPPGAVMIDAATLAGLNQALADARAAAASANAAAQKALLAASAAGVATAGTVVANGAAVAAPATPATPAAAVALSGPVVAAIAQGPVPDTTTPDGKKTVRVAYIPESTRTAMREQIKEEVLAQAKAERWGDPGALPDWMNRVSISGDVRFRNEYVKLNHANTPAGVDYSDGEFTRAANILGNSFNGVESPFDTQHNFDFWSLRARLNIDAKVSDKVSTGFTLSTGNTASRNSLSQNLGQNFNYYSVVLDKAFVKYDPVSWLSLSAGRIGNPFFSTDLLYADDVYFEGLALTARFNVTPTVTPWIVGGWFPIRMDNPGTSPGRNLGAIQAGVDWAITPKTQFKFGTAMYDFLDIAGTQETETAYVDGDSDYVTRYEYPAGFRQMGNTLFVINAPGDLTNMNWGLASKFKEIDTTASLDFARFDPFHVILTSDYVKNIGFKTHDIYERTGYTLLDGKNTGYQEKILVGAPIIKERGNWNVSLAYRYLGSDAVLDAYVNPDFGLGSTNTKGTIFTANYGIDKNTWITGRYLSSSLINSMVPEHAGSTTPPTQLNVDMIQLEFNTRY